MNKGQLPTIARYLGVAAAVCVPALVLAQALPLPANLEPGDVLRAQDVLQIRNALDNALGRIALLEARAINKSGLRPETAVVAAPPNATPAVVASCDADELMFNCGCRGLSSINGDPLTGTNNTSMDLRMVLVRDANATPSCTCQAQNVGTNADAALAAVAWCLPVD
jgi:hypothetical protein